MSSSTLTPPTLALPGVSLEKQASSHYLHTPRLIFRCAATDRVPLMSPPTNKSTCAISILPILLGMLTQLLYWPNLKQTLTSDTQKNKEVHMLSSHHKTRNNMNNQDSIPTPQSSSLIELSSNEN